MNLKDQFNSYNRDEITDCLKYLIMEVAEQTVNSSLTFLCRYYTEEEALRIIYGWFLSITKKLKKELHRVHQEGNATIEDIFADIVKRYGEEKNK